MIKRGILLSAIVVLFAASSVAVAQDAPKWTYIQAGYIDFDPDSGASDDGWYAGGSLNLFKHFHALAEYDDVGDYTFWNVGFGWHGLFGDPGDLFAQAQWNDVDVDSSNFSDDGYQLGVGVRWKIFQWLEANGQVNWIDFDQSGDDTTFQAGAVVTMLEDHVGAGLSWETGDSDTLRVFVRFSFGK